MRLNTNKVVLCDLDRTVADNRNRKHLDPLKNPNSSWSKYAQGCLTDIPIVATTTILEALYPRFLIYFISGRDDSSYDQTVSWLRAYDIKYDSLVLRAPTDERTNVSIKVDYIKRVRSLDLDPVMLIDDLQEVCEAVETLGVPTFQVRAPGLPEGPSEGIGGLTHA